MEVWSCDRIKIWKIKLTTNKGMENEKRKTEKEEEKKIVRRFESKTEAKHPRETKRCQDPQSKGNKDAYR